MANLELVANPSVSRHDQIYPTRPQPLTSSIDCTSTKGGPPSSCRSSTPDSIAPPRIATNKPVSYLILLSRQGKVVSSIARTTRCSQADDDDGSAWRNGLPRSPPRIRPRSSRMSRSWCSPDGHGCATSSNTRVSQGDRQLFQRPLTLCRHKDRLPPIRLVILHRRLCLGR